MATIRQRTSGSFEIIIRRKGVLTKPHYASADTREEAEQYAQTVEGLLDQGIVPTELLETPMPVKRVHLDEWGRRYLCEVSVSDSDRVLLNALLPLMASWPVDGLSMEWAHRWVRGMKVNDKLAPGSIRHKVGAVARMLDWCVRMNWLSVNPLRMLPKRYASYALGDGVKREDTERERRLLPGEEDKILWLLSGNIPEGKERGLDRDDLADWRLLFRLALETAMRLRELYTLQWSQVALAERTIFLDKTKNGSKRQVPLSSVAVTLLTDADQAYGDFVFPWWDGRASSLRSTTNRLSQKWSRIAALSGCEDLHFHDLRHEATSRFYERTTMTDLQIAKITGHKDLRMLARYSNLRGSQLSEMLW